MNPSARERRWRIVGLAGSLAICVLLGYFALFRDPRRPAVVWVGWAVSLATVALAATRIRSDPSHEISIDREGTIQLRASSQLPQVDSGRPLRAIFAAPWLITLVGGTMSVTIWPDSLPPDAYRRLWVCVRWGRRGDARQQVPTPNNE